MSERGTILPAIALLLFGGVLLFGLSLDLGRWSATWREAAFAADAGAESGAAMLDPGPAYAGDLRLDPQLAEQTATDAAQQARPREGRRVTARADASRVCVTVSQHFRPTILQAVGIGPTTVAATACAVPAQG